MRPWTGVDVRKPPSPAALDPRTWSAAEVRLQDFFAAYRGKDVKAVDAKTQQPLPPGSLLKLKDFPPQV